MATIAVIKTGAKQYKVKEGDKLKVEKLPAEVGSEVTFKDVLLVADSVSGEATVGTPSVKGATVSAKVVAQERDRKVKVVKYKSKTRQKKVFGHRQPFTQVEITKIAQ